MEFLGSASLFLQGKSPQGTWSNPDAKTEPFRARPSRLIHRASMLMPLASTRIHLSTATVGRSTSASRTTSTMRRSTSFRHLKSFRCQFPTIRMTVRQLVHPFCPCLSTQQTKQGAMLVQHTSSHTLRGLTFGLRRISTLPASCSREDLVTQIQRYLLLAMQVRAKAAHFQDPMVYFPTSPRTLSPPNIEDRGLVTTS